MMLIGAYSGLADFSCSLTAFLICCIRSAMVECCRMYVLHNGCHPNSRQGINLIPTSLLSAGPTVSDEYSYSILFTFEVGLTQTRGHIRKGI